MKLDNKQPAYEALVIGGSAGSFPVVTKILESLPDKFPYPVVLCLHRLKDKREGFKEALEIKSRLPVVEPDDKFPIKPATVYIAPANYHLLIETKELFALATTELVQYSRPSIDVLFESAADVFKDKLIGILLSGANRDGALGMKRIKERGGFTVIQDPQEAAMVTMPESARNSTTIDLCLKANDLAAWLKQLAEKEAFVL